MSDRLAAVLRTAGRALAASAAAAVVAGAVEGAITLTTPLLVVAAIGFTARLVVPVGFAAISIVAAVWAAWRPRELALRLTDETGGAPRLAAWLGYVLVAGYLSLLGTFHLMRWFLVSLKKPEVQALAAALAFVAGAGVLIALSRPAVGALTRGFRALDRRWPGSRAMRAEWVFGIALVAGAVAVWSVWRFTVRPRIGHLDLGVGLYTTAYVPAVVVALLVLWRVRRRAHLIAAIATPAALCVIAIGVATWVRINRPFLMLEIWATSSMAGRAVDAAYDVDIVRQDFKLGEVAPVARAGAAHPDVFLITIDTLRADRTPVYGGVAEMPGLARFAVGSSVFTFAFSPSNVTRRSLPAIATGVSPLRVRGRVAGWALAIDPRHVLLAERFQAAGYETVGFFCCRSQFGHDEQHRLGLVRGIDHRVIDRLDQSLVVKTTEWLRQRAARRPDRPLFVWIHLIHPHDWHDEYPVEGARRTFEQRYDAALATVDEWMAPLYEYLDSPEVKTNTVVVLTSDHGEGLNEHGHKFHSSTLFNSQIRVPLIIRGPGVAAQRVPQPVSLIDVAPTLLDLAGFEPPGMPQFDGRSLGPLLRAETKPDPNAVVLSHQVRDRSVSLGMDAIIAGRYKLIVPHEGKPLMYDILSDPEERRDLSKREPTRLQHLTEELERRTAALRAVPPF